MFLFRFAVESIDDAVLHAYSRESSAEKESHSSSTTAIEDIQKYQNRIAELERQLASRMNASDKDFSSPLLSSPVVHTQTNRSERIVEVCTELKYYVFFFFRHALDSKFLIHHPARSPPLLFFLCLNG